MATFTPPTVTERFDVPYPQGGDRLWSRVPYQRSMGVLYPDPRLSGTQATAAPGEAVLRSDLVNEVEADGGHVYLSGRTYTLSAGELTALQAAGYTAPQLGGI